MVVLSLTSQIADKVGTLHLALRFDAAIVQVSVEHDGRECQKEDGVGIAKALSPGGITLAVSTRKRLHQTLDLLRFSLWDERSLCYEITPVAGYPATADIRTRLPSREVHHRGKH